VSIEREQTFGVINSLPDPQASIVENYVMSLERWKADVIAQAEDATEYVLAQINRDQKAQIEELTRRLESLRGVKT
jgi:cell shape-determining protein MreC